MNIIPDILLLALLIMSVVIGYKKGFVKSVWKIAALAATIALVMALKTPAVNFLSGTQFAGVVHTKVSESINLPQGGGVNIAQNLNLPLPLQESVDSGINSASGAVSAVNEAAANSLSNVFITVIACVGLFILIRLSLMAVYMIINAVTKAPVIKGVNKMAGGILMLVNTVFVIFLVLALFSLFAPADSGMYDTINNTYLVKYFYHYNILLQIFMKI